MVVLPLSLTAEPDMMPGGPEMDAVACCLFFSLFLFFLFVFPVVCLCLAALPRGIGLFGDGFGMAWVVM